MISAVISLAVLQDFWLVLPTTVPLYGFQLIPWTPLPEMKLDGVDKVEELVDEVEEWVDEVEGLVDEEELTDGAEEWVDEAEELVDEEELADEGEE